MQEVHTIYMLEPVFDDSRYDGFAFLDHSSLTNLKSVLSPEQLDFYKSVWMDDDIPLDRYFDASHFSLEPAWDQFELQPAWKPLPVTMGHKKARKNDYPCINLKIPAVSPGVVEAMGDVLEANGELLPLAEAGEDFFAYNVLTVGEDAIDKDQTLFTYKTDREGTKLDVFGIDRFQFNAQSVQGLHIFRLPEVSSSRYYVTNVFKQAVEDAGLRGFVFNRVWPFSPEELDDPDFEYSDDYIYQDTVYLLDSSLEEELEKNHSLYSPAFHDLFRRYSEK